MAVTQVETVVKGRMKSDFVGGYLESWELTTADGTGEASRIPGGADRSVQAVGATWGGATCILEGSLDGGTTWFPLTDNNGAPVSFDADGGAAVAEAVVHVRPRLSTAGTGAEVTVYLFSRFTR